MRVALLAAFPLHVIPGLEKENRGGHYATWLPQLSAAWAKDRRLEIHWVVISRRISRPEAIAWNGQFFHLIHVPEKLRQLRFYRHDCRLICEKLDEIQPDIVHAWGTEDCYGLAAVRSGRKFLLSMQGILAEYVRRSRMPLLVYVQAALERFVLRQTEHVSAESTWGCDAMRRLAPHATVHRVEYGVQDAFFDIPWSPEPQRPTAIFVGTPDARKGLQDAVAAFANEPLREAELWIVGASNGAFAEALQHRSTRNVKWLGRKNTAETAALMAQAWCLVLPTRADTSPNVVKEARVIGLPAITSPHGGQTDYVQNGETGWIVECEDIAALTDRLARIFGSLEATRALGATRHAEHRAWFRPENTANGFLEVYRLLQR